MSDYGPFVHRLCRCGRSVPWGKDCQQCGVDLTHLERRPQSIGPTEEKKSQGSEVHEGEIGFYGRRY